MATVFCDREVHQDACCVAAADFLPPDMRPLLNERGMVVRQPTAREMAECVKLQLEEMSYDGRIDELTLKAICTLIDAYIPLADGEWWDDTHEEPE